jgi:Tol biopolymer transport system component/DNA-binding winged helix-turn-helix (wHTH) protein
MSRYNFGPFELDPEARLLRRDGEPIPLSGKTLDTLILLVENRGRLVDKEELLSRVWAGSVVEEASLTQTIFTARKILGDSPKDHRYIATIAGRGYQFVAPVTGPSAKGAIPESEAAGSQPDNLPEKSRSLPGRNRLVHWGVVAIVAAVLCAGILLWRVHLSHREDVSPESPRLYRFTSYPGVETMPSLSPDGNQIAYVRAQYDPVGIFLGPRQPGQANIYTKLVGAGTELRLTNHPGTDYYPAWSPDGQYIAFYRHEPGASGFYIISALGGHERRITSEAAEGSGIAWLPDGQHLLVSHLFEGSHRSPLMELSLDTGKERPVTSPVRALGDTWPAVSPDGRTVAFSRWKDSESWDVCSAPLSGGTTQCWPLPGYFPKGLAWTPSGDEIIFSAIRTGSFQLWRYGLNSNAPVALTSGEDDASLPTTSRASNRLAYVSYRRNENLWRLDIGSSQTVNPEDARSIASSSRMQEDPAFSPDGRKIAFLSDRSGPREIWVTELDTETSTQLTHFGAVGGSPSWSPDGLQIAFDSEQGVYVISADGGVPRRITANGLVPTWSRDGNSIYFASERSGEFLIWKVLAATGETQSHPAIQVTQGGGFRALESSDGKYLYYAKGRGKSGLWRRNLSDGKEEPVLETVEKWGWWALCPDVVYFLESAPSIRSQVRLRAFDIAHRSIRDIGLLRYPAVAGTVAIAASRDGRHLVYTQIDSVEADIMLMEPFR